MKPLFSASILAITFIINFSLLAQDLSVTINSGYVFLEGKLIEPPYLIEAKNMGIYINGIPSDYQLKYRKPIDDYDLTIDPLDPDTLDENLNLTELFFLKDKEGVRVVARKYHHIFHSYDRKTALIEIDKFLKRIKAFKSITKDTSVSSNDVYLLEDKYGNTIKYQVVPHQKPFYPAYETLIKHNIERFNHQKRVLSSGRTYYFSSYGIQGTLAIGNAEKMLSIIFANEMSSDQKISLIKKLVKIDDRFNESIVDESQIDVANRVIKERNIDAKGIVKSLLKKENKRP